MAAAMEMLLGFVLYAIPTQFKGQALELLPYLSGALIAAGLALLAADRFPVGPFVRRGLFVFSAAPLALLAIHSVANAWWGVAALCGILAAGVAAAPWFLDMEEAAPAPVPEQTYPDDPFVERLEPLLQTWTWILAPLVIGLSAVGGPDIVTSPGLAVLVVLGLTGYNIVAHLGLRSQRTPAVRVYRHLSFLTAALVILVVNAGPKGHGFLVLLVAMPYLAVRVAGPAAGTRLLALALALVFGGDLSEWFMQGYPSRSGLIAAVLDVVSLAAAATLGIAAASHQRRHLEDLSQARAGLQRHVERLRLVERIGGAIRHSLDLEEVLRTTVDQLGSALGTCRCCIQLTDDGVNFKVAYEYVAPGAVSIGEHKILRLIHGLFSGGGPGVIAIPDLAAHQELYGLGPGEREGLLATGARGVLAVPLIVEGELLGAISLHQCNGPRNWTADEISLLKATAGQVGAAIAHARVHKELRRSEETYRTLIEKIQDGFFLIQDGTVLLVNPAFAAMVGYTVEEITGLAFASLVAPEDMETVLRRYHERQQGIPTPSAYQFRMLHKDGQSRVHVGMHAGVILHGGRVATLGTVHDITQQIQMEHALRESEERYRLLVECSPVPIVVHRAGTVVFANPAAAVLLGAAHRDELIGEAVTAFVHPDSAKAVQERIMQMPSVATEVPLIHEKMIRRDGSIVDVAVGASLTVVQGQPAIQIVGWNITEQKRVEAQLLRMANYDPLTDLFNRPRFEQELVTQILSAQADLSCGAVLLLDIDHFKFVNDGLGYEAGDELLRTVAARLKEQVPEATMIGRFGEDEFGILLSRMDSHGAQAVARRILKKASREVVPVGGQGVAITLSIGIAIFPEHGVSAKEFMARADLAMYQAKEYGRNGFAVYTPELSLEVQMESKLTWERRIREALQQDRIILHWQPILNLHSDEVTQYEVLVRMLGDAGEIIPPGEFLPVAERFGLIHEIDRRVVRKAIYLLAEFQNSGRTLSLEVNLSGKCFADPGLLPMIRKELAATGIDPSMLVLEITETHAITDMPLARRFLDSLLDLGCRFAIDDFGSGFASFNHLKHLPVDYLKIDGSFIQNLSVSVVDQHLVKAIVEVARGLGKRTIAEFVGDADTLGLLREFGVDFAQGFHIGRPEPIPERTLIK